MNKFFPDNGFYQLNKDKDFWPRKMEINEEDRVGKPHLTCTEINSEVVTSKTRKDVFHEVLKIFMSLDEMIK